MAFSAAQLAALEKAAGSGTLSVQVGDRRLTYQSLSDLMAAIKMAREDVAAAEAAAGGKTSITRRYGEFARG